jgi:hypothetical protein
MTVIGEDEDKSEPQYVKYKPNIIKQTILLNDKIEEKLHVIAVISNPCLFSRRYTLMREFIKRMEMDEQDVILYIVELIYDNQSFVITDKNNKRHLQIKTKIPLWHKENMINLGVKRLLPQNWKAFAWIDADIEFENPNWASDTLKILNGCKDIVQVFSHCLDLDQNEMVMSCFGSFGYQFTKGYKYVSARGVNYWHPGYAWACTRKAYDKMGGLFEHGILGSGDYNMAMALINDCSKSFSAKSNNVFKQEILDLQERVKNLRLGYVPGIIRHYFHGQKKNRKYSERWQILAKYDYNPALHITTDINGVIIPTKDCPLGFIADIHNYFVERNEDEIVQ